MKKGRKKILSSSETGKIAPEEPKKRGRPPFVSASEVVGRADDYRWTLDQVWDQLWPLLSQAQSENDIITALEGARPYEQKFIPDAKLIRDVLQEKLFPTRRQSRINFLADSIAAQGRVTRRRSRDICAAERAKAQAAHHIIRYEYYVECSCGYKGPSKNHACRKCGAAINLPPLLASLQ